MSRYVIWYELIKRSADIILLFLEDDLLFQSSLLFAPAFAGTVFGRLAHRTTQKAAHYRTASNSGDDWRAVFCKIAGLFQTRPQREIGVRRCQNHAKTLPPHETTGWIFAARDGAVCLFRGRTFNGENSRHLCVIVEHAAGRGNIAGWC